MFSLMQVSLDADRLVLAYPLAVGVAFLLVAGALGVCAILARRRGRRRWAIAAATLVAAWAGIYFATFNATITNEGGSVYAFLHDDRALHWKDAADIYLERAGEDWRIVVLDRERRAFDFNVTDLAIEERDRVMAYMVDRMPSEAFKAAPVLLKRQAPEGPRRIGLFAEEQI